MGTRHHTTDGAKVKADVDVVGLDGCGVVQLRERKSDPRPISQNFAPEIATV